MKVTRRNALGAALGLAATGFLPVTGCRREGSALTDRHQILVDVAHVVIVPTYDEAANSAGVLSAAMDRLAADPSAASLASARDAWRRARAAWKRGDAFLFGPADDLAVTGGIVDAGPADDAKMTALLASSDVLDATVVASLGGNQRGFAGLEWLLFDEALGDDGMVAALEGSAGERRRLLGSLIGNDLRAKIEAVRDAWLPGKGDYASSLAEAGRNSTVYSSERQGVDAIVNALIAGSEVLTAIRLAKPLGLDQNPPVPHPELVESPRAGTSIEDILAVIDGIDAVYTCTFGDARGLPLANAVRDYTPGADDRLRADIEGARRAVSAIPAPLASAVVSAREVTIAAHGAVREIKRRLATEIASALGTSVGFNVTDGD